MAGDEQREQNPIDLFTRAEEGAGEQDRPQPRVAHRARGGSQPPSMRLDRLQIENLWSYRHALLDFRDGITVIAGPNGSGKSSLLESIFFALYGSKAGPAMERSLSDVLHIGAQKGSARLDFHHGGQSYTVQMALRRRGDTTVSDKEECWLTREDGQDWVGVEEVAQAVEALFGMNRDDFVNCVYVRQGEIDRLIRAGEDERRGMIDRLLRLERLDRYALRARDGARRAVNRKSEILRRVVRDVKREVEALQAEEPARRRAVVEERLAAKRSEQEALEEKLTQAGELHQRYRQKLERMEETAREIEEREEELDRKGKRLQAYEKRERELTQQHERLKKDYTRLRRRFARGLDRLEIPREEVMGSLDAVSSWEEIARLPEEYARVRERQEQLRASIQGGQSELARAREEVAEKRETVLQEMTQLKTRREHLEREHAEMRQLLGEGKCPVCGQPVTESTFGSELDDRERRLDEIRAQIDERRSRVEHLEAEREDLRTKRENALQELNDEWDALEERRGRLEELKELALRMFQVKEQGLERKGVRHELIESIDGLKEEIAQLKAKISELQGRLGERDEIVGKVEKVVEKLNELQGNKAALQEEISRLQQEHGKIQSQLDQLEKRKALQQETEAELAQVEGLGGEVEWLAQFYGDLKKDLRRRNIRALERYFNEFFRLMDPGSSYSRVRISTEYEIGVELLSGEMIRPELLSGGERALINIALRTAIHQVLSQASHLMPLMLDEPTIYLDRARVSRLQHLLQELGQRVGQVIFVSHEIGLVEGADYEYRTEKASDNTSRVRRMR